MPFALWRNNDLWNLLPASHNANNQKRDKLVSRRVLHRQRDTIIGYWELVRSAFGDCFDYELSRSLTGGERLPSNWKNKAFSALSATVETVALQRGIPRWEPEPMCAADIPESPSPEEYSGIKLLSFEDIDVAQLHEYLPLVGELAAGVAWDGFLTDQLDNAQEVEWVKVPERMRGKRRFVVRIAGESMCPTLKKGDLVVFEYHRRPRKQNQIVIAALAEFGTTSGITETVKRLNETEHNWEFIADNPDYPDFSIPKSEADYPILGTIVGVLGTGK
ncbi:MAG: S24 family peptidase [Lentisphaeria bacterium]